MSKEKDPKSTPWTSYDPWNHKGSTWISSNGTVNNTLDGKVGSVDRNGNIYNPLGNYIGKKPK